MAGNSLCIHVTRWKPRTVRTPYFCTNGHMQGFIQLQRNQRHHLTTACAYELPRPTCGVYDCTTDAIYPHFHRIVAVRSCLGTGENRKLFKLLQEDGYLSIGCVKPTINLVILVLGEGNECRCTLRK